MDESTTASSTKSSARERAEARRRRILEKSKDRLSVVSGTEKLKATTEPEASAKDTVDNIVAATADAADANNVKAETPVEGSSNDEVAAKKDNVSNVSESKEVSKGSSRLAQMRRRRYKKNTTPAAAPATTETTADSTTTATAAGASNESPVANVVNEEKAKEEPSNKAKNDDKPASSTTDNEDRKYLGVVKMRRKMLAEKKASEEAAQAAKSVSKKSTSSVTASKLKKDKKAVISLRPILVEFVTIIFLFLAGFDVGVQNHVVVNQEVPTIHDTFSINDSGIGAMKLVGGGKDGALSKSPDAIMSQDPFDLLDIEEEHGEFEDSSKPMGASSTSSTKEPNIDPVFGVDFDELTQGGGIFMSLVRAAVSIHRMLTYFFFLLPMSFITSLLALPKRIMVNPPILFLCSITIRYLGKHVLGGSIPDLDKMLEAEISDNDGMKPKESVAEGIAKTDFASMGTNFVKNFFKTNFPKLVLVYTIFTDARSDMFVVFCGFFLGLVLPSDLLGWSGTVTSVSEEL